MSPLGFLSAGEKAEIVEIREQKVCCQETARNQVCHAEDMGLRAGKVIEMLNNGGRGPLLIKVDESRIAIARGMAMKIMVKKAGIRD